MSKMNRRIFVKNGLTSALLGSSFNEAFARALIMNTLRGAVAEAQGVFSQRNYINLQLYGAPSRYQFDHWLRTNTDDPALLPAIMNSTAFTYNSTNRLVTGAEARLFSHNGVLVPHIFSTLSDADKNAFLDSFLVIRGYGSGVDGHDINSTFQLYPLSSEVSLSGLLADESNRFFQAVQFPTRTKGSAFVSHKSITINSLGQKPLDDLFKPITTASGGRSLRNSNQTLISNIRSLLNQLSGEEKAIKIAKNSLDNAYAILNSGVSDLSSTWTSLVADYTAVITNAVRSGSLPGIDATMDGMQSIGAVSDAGSLFKIDRIGGLHTITNGKNLLAIATEANIINLAESLAFADCCISNGLVSSVEVLGGDMMGVKFDPDVSNSSTNLFQFGMDHHQTGPYAVIYLMSRYYKGLMAGLIFLRQKLIASGKWDNTVIHIVSEFDRTIRSNNTGSDHGFNQMISSVFSGVIRGGPYVVGNIKLAPPSTTTVGTQGVAAPIQNYNQSGRPTPIMMASTVSQLLGVSRNPWQNIALPLIQLNGDGTLSLPFGKGKIVE